MTTRQINVPWKPLFQKKTLNWSLNSIRKQVIVIRLIRWFGNATDTNAFLDSCWQTLINSDLCQTFEAKLTVIRYPSAKVDAIENSRKKFLAFGSKNNKAQAAGFYHWFQQKKRLIERKTMERHDQRKESNSVLRWKRHIQEKNAEHRYRLEKIQQYTKSCRSKTHVS